MFRPTQSLEYVAGGRGLTTEIGGRDRFKFFKRSVVPTLEGGTQTLPSSAPQGATRPMLQRSIPGRAQMLQTNDNVGTSVRPPRTLDKLPVRQAFLSSTEQAAGGQSPQQQQQQQQQSGTTRDMACQTLYRESDTQTDPYTPDYFIEEGQQPAVLSILELRYGEGLPAGLGEIHMIDRVQRRKEVEANLPQGSDPESMAQRLNALEQLEKLEWEERESHIKGLQESRLKQLETALHKREEAREDQSRKRVETVRNQRLAEVQQKLQTLQDKRLTASRKLATKHANPCCEKEKEDIIKRHVLYGPRSQAVRTNALVEKINTSNYDVRPTLLSFPEGVQELERTAVPKLETVKSSALRPPEQPAVKKLETNYQKRLAVEVLDHLDYANTVIERSHEVKTKTTSIQDLYRATPRLQRPDTPTLTLQGDDEEEREEAILLLQRLIRGRALQNDFYEGKERCHGLIEELQSASNAKDAEYKWLPEQQREQFAARQEAMAQAVVDGVQADVTAQTLDYLFKELTRQQEASKVDQLRDLAEATRRRLEDTEEQKRADERTLRAKEELQYKAIIKATNATIEGYLVQLLDHAAEANAVAMATEEEWTAVQSRPVPPEPTNSTEAEVMVCDLLDGLVIPTVCRNLSSEKTASRVGAQALSGVATWAALSMVSR